VGDRRVLIVRHAVAAPLLPGGRDEDRPLTAEGREEFGAVVRALGRAGISIDRLYHSPRLRAVQTADLLAAPPDEALLRVVEGAAPALVGHQPWISALLAWLLSGRIDLEERLAMRKGGVALLSGPLRPGVMRLEGYWDPRHLAPLGR
jgi:phosphohistidine phosphatase